MKIPERPSLGQHPHSPAVLRGYCVGAMPLKGSFPAQLPRLLLLMRPVLGLRLQAPLRAVGRRQDRGPVHDGPPRRRVLQCSRSEIAHKMAC